MSNLGENLKSLREGADLSMTKLSKITKIQEKYLLRLENNEFEKMPNPVYIRGFIQKWANACGVDAEEFVLQFKRENEEIIKIGKSDKLNEISPTSFVVTSRHIILAIVIVVVVALAVFFYFNQKLISEIPKVEVMVPADFNIVTEEDSVFIRGEAQNTEKLFINGAEAFLNKEGIFELRYSLDIGLNTIIIKAKSSAGKEIETARKVLKL